MTRQFAKRSIAAALTTAALAFAAASPARAADQSVDWFERQRSLTDGVDFRSAAAPLRTPEGARSRVGEPAASPERQAGSIQQEWLIEQLRRSEGSVQ